MPSRLWPLGRFVLCSPRQTMGGDSVSDTSRVDPELAAFFRDVGQEIANYPPVRMEVPYEPHRRTLDTIALKATTGGPVMAETIDRWVAARGRRILCRLYRPRVNERSASDGPLPRRRVDSVLDRHARPTGPRIRGCWRRGRGECGLFAFA